MNKKTFIQFFLILLLIFLLLIISDKYFSSEIEETSSIQIDKKSINNKQNIIRDINYNSKSKNGDIFSLKANTGEVNLEDSDQLFLTEVSGLIISSDQKKIIITSNYADYNNKTFETRFIGDVKIISDEEIIKGDEFYIVLDATEKELKKNPNKILNTAILTGNIDILKGDFKLKADVIEIDLITWDSKVYMQDKNKKIFINNN